MNKYLVIRRNSANDDRFQVNLLPPVTKPDFKHVQLNLGKVLGKRATA